jgi:hypothetical protein
MSSAPKKPAAKKPAARRKPAHGRGELKTGNPGNRGGPGRPPNVLRNQSRRAFGAWLDWAENEMGKPGRRQAGRMLAIGKILAPLALPKQTELSLTGLPGLAQRLEGMSEDELRQLAGDPDARARLLAEWEAEQAGTDG